MRPGDEVDLGEIGGKVRDHKSITLDAMRQEFQRLEDLEYELEIELEQLRERLRDLFERIMVAEEAEHAL